jgi:GLPGLI family protein
MAMKFITATATFLLMLIINNCYAQNARFLSEGTIEYNKTVNMFALIKRNLINIGEDSFYQQAFDAYKKSQPQFKILKSTLAFSNNKTLFKPEVSRLATTGGFFSNEPSASQYNTIFTDLSSGTSISQKNVYEETFLIQDSTRKIIWKITDEIREIAGYSCRRANAIMLDSIYVVAFYTDQIPVSGGPESFSGLPGMILGVALPHENITWFATKVNDVPIGTQVIAPPTKGKAMDFKTFKTFITTALKDWGDYAKAALKGFVL